MISGPVSIVSVFFAEKTCLKSGVFWNHRFITIISCVISQFILGLNRFGDNFINSSNKPIDFLVYGWSLKSLKVYNLRYIVV